MNFTIVGVKTVLSNGSSLQNFQTYSEELFNFLRLFRNQSKQMKKEFLHYVRNVNVDVLFENIDEVFCEEERMHNESVQKLSEE
jgi:hypothetical protein